MVLMKMRAFVLYSKQFRSIFSYQTSQSRLISVLNDAAKQNFGEVNRAGPIAEYERRILEGKLVKGDSYQVATLRELQRLYDELIHNADAFNLDPHTTSRITVRPRWWWSNPRNSNHSPVRGIYLYGGTGTGKTMMMDLFFDQLPRWWWSHSRNSKHSPVRGIYLYGGTGTGKTMMMDLFFDQLPHSWRKQRIHFHDFMLAVQSRLHKHKGVEDPFELVAEEILEESVLLCFDEFMVPDIAVASILHRFFKHLFSKGAILVATSNRAPQDLYQSRLQREYFLPFVGIMQERCVVHEINSSIDYRKKSLDLQGFYFVGNNIGSNLKQEFEKLVGEHVAARTEVEVAMGRKLQVPLGANGCAYFTFDQLCNKPLGAADYFALSKNFHTLVLEGVPIFGVHNKPAAYRFVILIDVMYDNKVRLFYTAEGSPAQLFERIVKISMAKNMVEGAASRSKANEDFDLIVDDKLEFSKHRAISRLTEMISVEYLKQHAARLQLAR